MSSLSFCRPSCDLLFLRNKRSNILIDKCIFSVKVITMKKLPWVFIVVSLPFLSLPSVSHGFFSAGMMRPPVEPPRVEYLLDSMLTLGDPGDGLTRFVEDSANLPEERSHAATVLAAYHNRNEEPARGLLALFYISRELGADWTPEQAFIASEAYARLGNQEWAEESLDKIPYTSYLKETVQALRIYGAFEEMKDPDSLIEIRSRFERQLERSSDPAALILSLHGLGLCYLAKGSVGDYDTASVLLSFAMEDTASAYLSFALEEYRKLGQDLPLISRLMPYGIYWAGIADTRRGDGWGALKKTEEIYLHYPHSRFWNESVIRYSALQMRRGLLDSARVAAQILLARSSDPHRVMEARLVLATVLGREEHYEQAAVEFAALSRSIEVGDTLRVLSHAGMVGSLIRYTRTIFSADSIPVCLSRLNLSGYNPLAISQVCAEVGERYLAERDIGSAEQYLTRALRYYPDPVTEFRSRLALAGIGLAEGDWDASIENYERVEVIADLYNINLLQVADLHFNMGLAYLERARNHSPDRSGDLRKARSSFREASKLDPHGETGSLARQRLENLK